MSRIAVSPVTAIADPVTLEYSDMLHFPHQFVTIAYFSDAAGTTPAEPATGTITAEYRYHGAQGFVVFSGSPVDASDNAAFVDCAGPAVEWRFTPTGVDVATHYRITVIGSEA